MRPLLRAGAFAFELYFAFALAACSSGGAGSSSVVPPGASLTYSPKATVYQETYAQFNGPPQPLSPLWVNTSGTIFYFLDFNYGYIELNNGVWSTDVSRTFNYGSIALTVRGGPFDGSNDLYSIAETSLPSAYYLVSHGDAATGQTVTPLGNGVDNYTPQFDLEASSTPGRVYIAGSPVVEVVDAADTSSATVHNLELPASDACCGAFRITEGANNDLYYSVAGSFNQIFRYSASLQLLASATVLNASHINEIAADPDGGVWFADDVGNHLGKMSAIGTVTEYPLPANMHISAVATASDGSIWIALSASAQKAYVGHVSESGAITTYSLPSGLELAEYLRGTFDSPAFTPNRLYWLDDSGNVGVIDLNP